MPTQYIEDPETKERIPFEWNKPEPPTSADIDSLYQAVRGSRQRQQPVTGTPPVASVPTQAAPQAEKGFMGTMASNILPSAAQFLKDVVTPIVHPIETAKGIGSAGLGAIESLIPGEQGHEKYAEGVLDFLKQRYGGIENIKKTAMTDPVGMLSDVASVVSGVGAGAKVLGGAGKVANVISKTGKYMEPITLATKAASIPAKFSAEKAIMPVLGLTTGVGAEAVKRSAARSPEFIKGMRGKIREADVISQGHDAMSVMRYDQVQDYLNEFRKMKASSNKTLDISPVQRSLATLMDPDHFNIIVTKGKSKKGKAVVNFDFSRSTLDPSGYNDFKRIYADIMGWGKTKTGAWNPADRTLEGVDRLKRRLDNFYSDNPDMSAIVTELRDTTKNVITAPNAFPQYGEMTAKYKFTTDLMNEMKRSLKLGNKASIQSSISAFKAALSDNGEFRRKLVDALEKKGGKQLLDQLAGASMNPVLPSTGAHAGLAGRIGAGALFTTLFGASPQSVAMIASTSPRLVAEFNNAVANAVAMVKKTSPALPMGLYQAGRVTNMEERNAREAIKQGADPRRVADMYKQRTGKELGL